jgi:uncharacterized protein YcbX
MAIVTELYTYPVKGCARVPLAEAKLTEAGLAHDRTFLVTHPDGEFRTQRRDRRLAVIQPEVGPDGTRLTLRAPGVDALCIDVDLAAARCEVKLFGVPTRASTRGTGSRVADRRARLTGHAGPGAARALGYAKLAIRCMVTMVDQRTGNKAGPEPLRTTGWLTGPIDRDASSGHRRCYVP